jgi:hypothetical protein
VSRDSLECLYSIRYTGMLWVWWVRVIVMVKCGIYLRERWATDLNVYNI